MRGQVRPSHEHFVQQRGSQRVVAGTGGTLRGYTHARVHLPQNGTIACGRNAFGHRIRECGSIDMVQFGQAYKE